MAVPSNEKDLSGRPGHLDQSQQQALDEFRSKVEQSHDQSQRKWYDDTTLLRFLRARSFSVPKAIEQLSTSSQWRQTQKVDSTYESFPIDEFEDSRSFYPRWNGRRDRLGRPIYIYRLASLASHSKELMQTPEERRYQRIISLTEFLCRFVLPLCADLSSDKSVDCVTTIIDLEGISLSSLWSLKSHLQQSIQLTSANYPETINTICVVNAPSFFPTIWGWVKGMFDEGTRNKVHLIGSGTDPASELGDVIDLDNLPKVYGGRMEWKYEDEPMLDEEIKKSIGADSTRGPVVWENGRMVLLGEGRREEQGGKAPPAAESTNATRISTDQASSQIDNTSTPSPAPPPGTQTPAAPTAPGPPSSKVNDRRPSQSHSTVPIPTPSPLEVPSSAILPSNVPENAPEHCPGVESTQAGKADACDGCPNQSVCAEGPKGPDPDIPLIRERMSGVKRKVLVLSGKGGVGKSTFSAGLSWALAADDECQTGIMDVDICGPSIPLLMGLNGTTIHTSASGWSPAYAQDNLSVMSIGFLLPSSSDAVIWRGPKKNGLIKQFLKDVEWGDLDYMVVDTPPGTSDEHLSIVQYLKETGIDGAVLITTPQEVALQDVRKEIDFCRKVGIPILGLVENMSGFVCPKCTTESEIFKPTTGGAEAMGKELGIEFLGKIPLDPRIGMTCDQGLSFLDEWPDSPATTAYLDIVQRIRELLGDA